MTNHNAFVTKQNKTKQNKPETTKTTFVDKTKSIDNYSSTDSEIEERLTPFIPSMALAISGLTTDR